jgi:hypothetical protein
MKLANIIFETPMDNINIGFYVDGNWYGRIPLKIVKLYEMHGF